VRIKIEVFALYPSRSCIPVVGKNGMRASIDASMKADDHERQNPAAENRGLDPVCKDERDRRSLPSSAGRSGCGARRFHQ
jgi:hypothetical protein